MKTLILVRHAKSSWKYDVEDVNRPLKNRGITDANLVSRAFNNRKLSIDNVFSSPANRAYSTCEIFLNNLNINVEKVQVVADLYDFGGHNVMFFVKSLNEFSQNVMIFGHNHAFTSICNIFGDVFIENLPTSGLVVIDFDTNSWHDIQKGSTRFTIFPKDLK